jgi:chorismate synthase
VSFTEEAVNKQLARRWIGFGRGGRSKIEKDKIHIYSGVRFKRTMGSPIAMRLDNAAFESDKAGWPSVMSVEGSGDGVEPVTLPRPGHADLTGTQKYGFTDIRPVIDRASARETAMRVACCTVAREFLRTFGIEIGSHVVAIGEVSADTDVSSYADRGAEALSTAADDSLVRMVDPATSNACIEHIKAVKKRGDSLGGVYEVVATGVPVGLGSYVHWDRKLDGLIGQAILSIQGQKAVEIGEGVRAAGLPGSEVHDEIVQRGAGIQRDSNRAGGIEGGMSNGMPIVVRGYMKPIPTLIKPLGTVDIESGEAQATRYERSDVTSVPAASTVAEAVVAMVLANAFLEKFGGDSVEEILLRYRPA